MTFSLPTTDRLCPLQTALVALTQRKEPLIRARACPIRKKSLDRNSKSAVSHRTRPPDQQETPYSIRTRWSRKARSPSGVIIISSGVVLPRPMAFLVNQASAAAADPKTVVA